MDDDAKVSNSVTSSRNPSRRSSRVGSVSIEPKLFYVEEEDSVFSSTENIPDSTNSEPNKEMNGTNSEDGYNRELYQRQRRLRAQIEYHFMNPWEKYKARNRKPWKLLIQIFKIIIVTVQVYLFGADRFSVVNFMDDNQEALRYLFLKDYGGDANAVRTVYTKNQVYMYLKYAHEQYYNIAEAAGSYAYTDLDIFGDPPAVRLCYDYYKQVELNASSNSYTFDPTVINECDFLPKPHDHQHIITNTSFNFGRLLSLKLDFLLNAINLKGVKAWDKPTCYQLNVTLLFDNKKRDGQMPINLNLENNWLQCKADSQIHSIDSYSTIIRILLIVFDSLVVVVCLASLTLSVRSLIKCLKLIKEARAFFIANEDQDPLSLSDAMDLFNWWFVIIIISDILTILGSIYKMAIDQKDSNFYDVCSLLLGIAVLLVWTGLLRFLGYLKQYNVLLLTLKASGPSILRFCVCAGVLFLGFTFCGWIVIGPYNTKFRDTTVTAEALYSLVNGDDMYNTYAMVNPESKAIWVYSKLYLYVFISLFIYVVLSLFIGIIADTYERLKDMGELPPSRLHRFVEETSSRNTGDTEERGNGDQPRNRALKREQSTDSVMRRMSLDSTGLE